MKISTLTICLLILIGNVSAQKAIAVKDEPGYKTVFRNKLVNIMYARVLPGDTSSYHIHENPTLFLVVTDSRIFDQTMGKAGEVFPSRRGDTWYADYFNKQVHRVSNMDTGQHLYMLIELLNQPKSKEVHWIEGLGEPDHFKRARVYPFRIEGDQEISFKTLSNPVLIVSYDGDLLLKEKGKTTALREADIKWLDEGAAITLQPRPGISSTGYIYEIIK